MDNELERFAENATAPKRVQTDSGSVEQHSIADQIKALEYLKKERATNPETGVRKPLLSRLGIYQIVNRG